MKVKFKWDNRFLNQIMLKIVKILKNKIFNKKINNKKNVQE